MTKNLENLSRYSRLRDLWETAQQIGIHVSVWDKEASARYIAAIFARYRPLKTWGHVQIGAGRSLGSAERCQYRYAKTIAQSPLLMIFDQNHREDRQFVLQLENGASLYRLMEENGGLEYFLSDTAGSFLVAVNRYCIEYCGEIDF
ncbi:TPA: hypothetical protein ACFP4Y_000840 [Neisseria bacilliformis]